MKDMSGNRSITKKLENIKVLWMHQMQINSTASTEHQGTAIAYW